MAPGATGMTLTTQAIKDAKPSKDGKRRWIHDREGLYLVIQPSGAKSWAYRGRLAGGKIIKKHLAPVPTGEIKKDEIQAARRLAIEARKAAHGGTVFEPPKPTPEAERGPTVAASWKTYAATRAEWSESTAAEQQRIFDRHIEPEIGARPIAGVVKADLLPIYDAAGERGPAARNKTTAVLTGFFRWAHEERDLIATLPTRGLKQRISKEPNNRRTLSDAEIVKVWKACDQLDREGKLSFRYGAMIKLLLLTGCRRNEVGGLPDAEINGAKWNLPGARTKNRKPLVVHLGATAQAILKGVPRIEDCAYVFGPCGERCTFAYSDGKEALDAIAGIAPWRLHDLRRTFRTGLGKLGVPEESVNSTEHEARRAQPRAGGQLEPGASASPYPSAAGPQPSHRPPGHATSVEDARLVAIVAEIEEVEEVGGF